MKLDKNFILIALISICASCSKPRPYHSAIREDIGFPKSELKDFWITPLVAGRDMRSIGMDPTRNLFILWERLDGMPITEEHSLYGNYEDAGNLIEFITPFGDRFAVKKEKVNGIDVMLPKSMTVNEALSKNWLMIHRSGATADKPFTSDNLTSFDRESK